MIVLGVSNMTLGASLSIGAGVTEVCFRLPSGWAQEMVIDRDDGRPGTALLLLAQGARLAHGQTDDLLPGTPLPVRVGGVRLSDGVSTYAVFSADAAGCVSVWLRMGADLCGN